MSCTDVFAIYDMEGVAHQFLSIVDCGTTFHMCTYVRTGAGSPSSARCIQKFMTHWVSWAGWPRIVTTDRGTHNRGVFAKTLGKNGVYIRNVGLESPEHLGRGERHGGILKTNLKRIIREHQITTKAHVKMATEE